MRYRERSVEENVDKIQKEVRATLRYIQDIQWPKIYKLSIH